MPGEQDFQILEALQAARQHHAALADLIGLYYDLYQVQFRAKAEIPEPIVRDEIAMRWRLEGGIPQVTFDQLGIEPQPFARLVEEIAHLLVRHNHPASQCNDQEWTPQGLVARAQEIVKGWNTLLAPRPMGRGSDESVAGGLTVQAVGFALAPYLQRAADLVLPRLDLSSWNRGYCPVCGGRPNLALLARGDGPRRLVCSRCAAEWTYAGETCPFCTSNTLLLYLVRAGGLHRLYVCPGCNSYLKAVDLSQSEHEIYPQVEYLLTVGMDLEARQAGYGN